MAKMACECGAVFRFGDGSLPGEHVLIPDKTLSEILDQPDQTSGEDLVERIDESSRAVFFCQSCDRVYLEMGGARDKTRFTVYRPSEAPNWSQ